MGHQYQFQIGDQIFDIPDQRIVDYLLETNEEVFILLFQIQNYFTVNVT